MRIPPAPEGAGRYDHADPDEGKIDIEPFMEAALEDVVETILRCAQYPQPRRPYPSDYPLPVPPPRRVLFDLYEFVNEEYARAELVEMVVGVLTTWGSDLAALHLRETAKLEQMLITKLRGSEIVADRAEDLANEAREK